MENREMKCMCNRSVSIFETGKIYNYSIENNINYSIIDSTQTYVTYDVCPDSNCVYMSANNPAIVIGKAPMRFTKENFEEHFKDIIKYREEKLNNLLYEKDCDM